MWLSKHHVASELIGFLEYDVTSGATKSCYLPSASVLRRNVQDIFVVTIMFVIHARLAFSGI